MLLEVCGRRAAVFGAGSSPEQGLRPRPWSRKAVGMVSLLGSKPRRESQMTAVAVLSWALQAKPPVTAACGLALPEVQTLLCSCSWVSGPSVLWEAIFTSFLLAYERCKAKGR